jgi:hypothetical protein
MSLPRDYDTWRLQGPAEPHQIGTDEGDTCNRVAEPDEDAPRGYRPRPCTGVMELDECGCCVWCRTCGEFAG